MSKFKNGKELIQEWNIKDFELFEHVKAGLQPFNRFGRPLPPPDVYFKKLLRKKLKDRSDFLKFRYSWITLSPEEKIAYCKRDVRTAYGLQQTSKSAQSECKSITRELESLDRELSQIPDINSWANYELPEDGKSAEGVINSLLNAFFKLDDVSIKVTPQQPVEPIDNAIQRDADDFIRNLKVEYSSDTSVILTPKGKQSKEYSYQQMGFKSTAQTWALLIGVLQKDDPQYHVGIYPKDKSRDKVKKYNSTMQIIKAFEKKFVDFLNCEYSAQIPGNSRVFRNMKGFDRDGTYRPIFQVANPATEIEENIGGMSREQWKNEIEILAEEKRREKDPKKETRLLAKMGPYIALGNREGWLNPDQAKKYLEPNDEDRLLEDALSHAGPLPYNT